jgi:hypothetical protein
VYDSSCSFRLGYWSRLGAALYEKCAGFSHGLALEPTPLCGPKIGCILKSGLGPTVFPIYQCGAAQRQAVSPLPIKLYYN